VLTSSRTQIQFVLNREQQIAKEQLATGHKDRALLALRRRKYQQGLLERTDGQLHNLEELVSSLLNLSFPSLYRILKVSTIEFSLVQVSVLHGLKQGNDVLKEIHREMSIEDVERLLDETAEARAYQQVCHYEHMLSAVIAQTC
jgi:charged multivesicular body protein 6